MATFPPRGILFECKVSASTAFCVRIEKTHHLPNTLTKDGGWVDDGWIEGRIGGGWVSGWMDR